MISSMQDFYNSTKFVTKEIMPPNIRNDLIGHYENCLPAFKSGETKYLAYRKERFLQKITKIGKNFPLKKFVDYKINL